MEPRESAKLKVTAGGIDFEAVKWHVVPPPVLDSTDFDGGGFIAGLAPAEFNVAAVFDSVPHFDQDLEMKFSFPAKLWCCCRFVGWLISAVPSIRVRRFLGWLARKCRLGREVEVQQFVTLPHVSFDGQRYLGKNDQGDYVYEYRFTAHPGDNDEPRRSASE